MEHLSQAVKNGKHIALFAVIGAGLTARIGSIFNFFVYPDSYYYLLLAKNLREGRTLFGRLGPEGMPFPPIGAALFKPVYPLAISLVDIFVNNLERSGHAVAVGASVGSIAAAYLLGRRLFGSVPVGLAAAFLIAFSTNHIFWGGFIMGDTLSLFLFQSGLLLLLNGGRREYGNPVDFLGGFFLALAVLSRVAYVVFIPALIWLMAAEYSWSKERLTTAAAAFGLTLSVTAVLFFAPFSELVKTAAAVSAIFFWTGISAVLLGLGVAVFRRVRVSEALAARFKTVLLGLLVGAPAAAELLNLPALLANRPPPYSAVHRFIVADLPLSMAYFAGAVLALRSKHRRLALFCAANVALALIFYYQVEAWESRYLVHLLPFLVLLGGFALARAGEFLFNEGLRRHEALIKALAGGALAVLALALLLTTAKALRSSPDPALRTSYPREVSRSAGPKLKKYPRDTVAITALPWPYFFHLGFSTWGLDPVKPDAVLKRLPKKERFLVINDLALRYHFPALSRRLRGGKSTEVARFSIPTAYQYGYFALPGPRTVTVHDLTAADLARALRDAKR